MTAEELKQWRKKLGYTQEQAAKALWISRPTIARYEKDVDIPKTIELACFYLSSVNDKFVYEPSLEDEEHIKQICLFLKVPYVKGDFQRHQAYAQFKRWNKTKMDERDKILYSNK